MGFQLPRLLVEIPLEVAGCRSTTNFRNLQSSLGCEATEAIHYPIRCRSILLSSSQSQISTFTMGARQGIRDSGRPTRWRTGPILGGIADNALGGLYGSRIQHPLESNTNNNDSLASCCRQRPSGSMCGSL